MTSACGDLTSFFLRESHSDSVLTLMQACPPDTMCTGFPVADTDHFSRVSGSKFIPGNCCLADLRSIYTAAGVESQDR